ncbi:MAG: hypothetical protein HY361_02320 [Candidatus Aenigmarchaeota archaeon]|nr:hypothetical protein [Candidatus Aenigmarchaeota archaeon]
MNSFVLSLLLLLPLAIAQSEIISRGLLRSVLGPLPEACTFSISSSDCIACLGTVKFLPFAFFFGLIYFAMVFLVFRILGQVPNVEGRPADIKTVTPSLYYAAILISLALALLTLHFRETSMFFISISQFHRILIISLSIVIVITFLHTLHGLSPMYQLVTLLFSIGIVWTFYNLLTQPGGLLTFEPSIPIAESPCFLST